MQDFGTKADNSPPPGGQLSAAEFNNLATENENAVLHSGQTLSGASESQLAQSLFLHGVKAESFQDSGVANAYVATPTSGASGVLLPADYTALAGAVISFKASATNSGASTLNIGQTTGALLGSKAIRAQGDVAVASGAIVSGQYIQVIYNPALDAGVGAWELLPWSGNAGKLINTQIFTASGTYTPTQGMRNCRVRAIGGGGGSAGLNATAAAQYNVVGGGGSSGYLESLISSATIGASQVVTIGAGGAAGGIGLSGGNGGTTSLGAILSVAGGQGSAPSAPISTSTQGVYVGGDAGIAPTTGNILNSPGTPGKYGIFLTGGVLGGDGGASVFGAGGKGLSTGAPPNPGGGYGAGAGGTTILASTAGRSGAAGSSGILIIEEYS